MLNKLRIISIAPEITITNTTILIAYGFRYVLRTSEPFDNNCAPLNVNDMNGDYFLRFSI